MPRWLGTAIFFSVALAIWTGVHVYLYTRATSAVDIGTTGRTVAKGVVAGLALAYLLGRLLDGRWDAGAWLFTWVGAVWMGFAALAATVLAARDLGVALPLKGLVAGGMVGPEMAGLVTRWSARAALGIALAATVWGLVVTMRGPAVTEVEVALKGLPARMDGFRLVQLSDIHVGETVGPSYLEGIAEVVAGTRADLVVVTGDLTDERDGGDGTGLARLGSVASRLGVMASTGNHEVYAGGQPVIEAIERAGMAVLRQSHRVVEDGLVIAGIDDPTFLGGRGALKDAIKAAVAGTPEGLPIVLLAHQPLGLEAAAELGVGLMLCGHTHGGQLPPFTWLNQLAFPFVTGRHRVGDMVLSVSNGTGYWGPPVRVFANPEIIVYTLRAAQGGAS